jgi:hypothetical protein
LPGERDTYAGRSPGHESYTHGTYDTVLSGNCVRRRVAERAAKATFHDNYW